MKLSPRSMQIAYMKSYRFRRCQYDKLIGWTRNSFALIAHARDKRAISPTIR